MSYKIQYKALGIVSREKTVTGVRALQRNLTALRFMGANVTDVSRA